ncbi:YhgE/Pip domain-containing protein [Ornithinibacillus xuwenensis]|uniref:YhgE/Pip domain-containing protein n=1 Tax=Ornithinibacillus xuwenensis TaxID=3144668 RepID=A0ABU9XI76_9BACI
MRRMKKILLVLAAVILLLPSFLITAKTNDNNVEERTIQGDGEVASKDEVIYATLDATGESKEVYVVNTLDVIKEGSILDYGHYSSLRNLTNLEEIDHQDDAVKFTASAGKFYYQGNINDAALPWDISVSYFLEGKEISPEELAGEDGRVQIRMETSANEDVNPVFTENYLLQISLTLDTEVFRNIKAADGMIANAGKNKQVTFTVMPEDDAELVLEADVEGFELDGINFSGVPSSMPIDEINVDGMTGDINSLTSAIAEINDGVGELDAGVTELNNGVVQLVDGSEEYKNGVADLANSSSELVNGSKEIKDALINVNNSLSASAEMDLSGMQQLIDGLNQLSDGLNDTAAGLDSLKTNYGDAYQAIDYAIRAIPAFEITEAELEALSQSNANQAVINELVDTYTAAQAVKATYTDVKPGFDAVETTLTNVNESLLKMANDLDLMTNEISSSLEKMEGFEQLQQGIGKLSSNYKTFHDGLVEYTGGVSQLSDAYQEIHHGMVELSEGTAGLGSGVGKLHNGTAELRDSTSNLPEQMNEEIDEMMSEYDKSDFEPVSFVSSKNENVNSVQFVFKTESIIEEKPEINEEPIQEEKGLWDLFLDLFR